MRKHLAIIGAIITFLVSAIKLMFLTRESYLLSIGFLVLFSIIDFLFIIAAVIVFIRIIKKAEFSELDEEEIFSFIAILTGALVVYFFGTEINIDKNITVGLVAIITGLLVKKYTAEAVLGAIIGAGLCQYTGYFGIIFISVFAGIFNTLLKEVFVGIGGKSGTIAFVGGIIVLMFFGEVLGNGLPKDNMQLLFILLVSFIAALLTFILNNDFNLGPTIAYGIVILLGSVYLLIPATKSLEFSSIIYGSALLGMSNKNQKDDYFIMIIASIIFSFCIFVGTSFINIGGRVGLLALISVLTVKEPYYLIKKQFTRPYKEPVQIV